MPESATMDDVRPIPPLIPIVLRGKHLEETSITKLRIESDRYKIVGMTREFAQSLKHISSLYLSCPLELSLNNGNFSSLHHFGIGFRNADEVHMARAVSNVNMTAKNMFPVLTELNIANCNNISSWNLARVAPRVEDLNVSYCYLSEIPRKWQKMAPTIRAMHFHNTSFFMFDASQFQSFSHLKTLEFSNFMYNDERDLPEDVLPRNTFIYVQLYNLPQLERFIVNGIMVTDVVLGKRNARTNVPFANLKRLEFDPAVNLEIETSESHPSTFLPSLKRVLMRVDDRVDDEEEDADWYERNRIFFPFFLLGIPTLQQYEGSYYVVWIGVNNIDLDAYVMPDPAVTTYPEARNKNVRRLLRWSDGNFTFSSSNEPLQHAIRDAAARNEQRRLRGFEELQAAEALLEEDTEEEEVGVEEVYLEERQMEAAARARIEAVRRRGGSGTIRRDPYFIKYNVQNCTGNPFALDNDGIPLRTCPVCAEAFTKAYHDAEDERDVNNNDFMEGESRQQVLRDSLVERPEAPDGKGLGCVVVCNVLPSDFDANMLNVMPSQSKEEAVSLFQHTHYNHWYHRVCYSKLLIQWREERGWTQCPETDIRFYPSLDEMPANI